ncbi:MAG: zinc ribbon domain-containing protein [Bacteroidia bacterium]
MANVIQCPTCGGSVSPRADKCSYCGNFLVHLSVFETRAPGAAVKTESEPQFRYFRSLKPLYQVAVVSGLIMAGLIYFFMFDNFSEDELVAISPLWFLLIVFGTAGLFTEKAVKLVLNREEKDFPAAIVKATASFSLIVQLAVYLIFFVPFFVLGLVKRFSSPLIIATLITLVWAAVLYFFLVGIFPSL